MRTKIRYFLSVPVLVLVVVLACGIAFIKSDFAAQRVCSMLHQGLRDRLGVEASIDACQIDLLPPSLRAKAVVLEGPQSGRLLQAAEIGFELDSLSLLVGDFQIDRIHVSQPQLHLRLVDGRLVDLPSFESSGGGDGTGTGLPEHIDLEGGQLNLVVDRWGLIQVRDLAVQVVALPEGRLELGFALGGGSVDLARGEGLSLPVQPGRCQAVKQPDQLELANCEFGVGQASLKASGLVGWPNGQLRPELELTVAGPLELIHQLVPSAPAMRGQLVVQAQFDPELGGLGGSGLLDLKGFAIGTLSGLDLQSRFSVSPEALSLEQLRLSAAPGRISGRARLAFDDALSLSAGLVIEHLELIRSLREAGLRWRYIDLRGAGEAEVEGQLRGKAGPSVGLKTRMALERFDVQTAAGAEPILSLGGSNVRGEANFNPSRVRISAGRFQRGESIFDAQGTISYGDWTVDASISTPHCMLADVSPVAGLAVAGETGFELDIGGTIHDPVLAAQVYARDLAFEGHPFGYLRGRVVLEDFRLRFEPLLLARHGGSVRLTGSLGLRPPHQVDLVAELSRIKLPELVAAVRRSPRPTYLGGLVGGRLAVSGSLEAPALDFGLAFADLRVWDQHFAEAGAVGRYSDGAWRLDLLEARMGPGWLFAQGEVSKNLELDLTAYSTGLRAASFEALSRRADLLDFRLDLHVSVQGPLRSPAFGGWAKVYDMVVAGRELPDSKVKAEASAEQFRVSGSFLGQVAKLDLTAKLEEGLPFAARLDLAAPRLGDYLPPIRVGDEAPVAALVGALTARGHLLDPAAIQSDLVLDRAEFSLGKLGLKNRGPLKAQLREGRLTVLACELGGASTQLTVRGGGELDSGPRLSAEGTVDLGLLPALTQRLPRASGQASLALAMTGQWARPELSGSLLLAGERIRVAGLPADLEAIGGRVNLSPSRIEIERLTGRFGGGAFTLWGGADLSGFELSELALTIELDRARYQASRALWGIGTGTLNLTKRPDERFALSGQLRMHEGGYQEQLSLVSLSGGLFRRRRPRARTYDRKREWLDFDVRLIVPDQFEVDYNLDLVRFVAEMKGEVRLSGTNERLGVLGELEAVEGRVSYLSKDFAVQAARVQFVDEYGIEPRFEILASRSETVDRGEEGKISYEVNLALNGKGDDVRVSLRSSPPLNEPDIVTLLSLGITTRDLDRLKGDDLIGLGGEIFLRSLQAEERFSKFFPFPPEVIQPKYLRMRSRYSEHSKTTTPRLEAGVKLRFISDDLDLGYSRSLYVEEDQSLDLSYQLSKGITTQLRWESAQESDYGDLGLDLRLEWEW